MAKNKTFEVSLRVTAPAEADPRIIANAVNAAITAGGAALYGDIDAPEVADIASAMTARVESAKELK